MMICDSGLLFWATLYSTVVYCTRSTDWTRLVSPTSNFARGATHVVSCYMWMATGLTDGAVLCCHISQLASTTQVHAVTPHTHTHTHTHTHARCHWTSTLNRLVTLKLLPRVGCIHRQGGQKSEKQDIRVHFHSNLS